MRNSARPCAYSAAFMRRPSLCSSLLAALSYGVLFCGACAAPEEAPQGDQLTAETELPEEYRECWRAWYDNAPDWPTWRARVADDPRLARFVVDNLVRVMIKFYDHSAMTRAGDLPGFFERAQRELIWMAKDSGPVMVELVMVGDGVVSFLAGDVLVRIDDPQYSLSVANKLEDPEGETRRRAAQLLGKLPHAQKNETRVLDLLEHAALEDSEWFVRAETASAIAARALIGADAERSRRILSRALSDGDRAVVLAACEGLGSTRDLDAVPALLNLLERMERGESGDLAQMRAAQAALVLITGQRDLQGASAWRGWWRENRP
jgi:HEAT repeats